MIVLSVCTSAGLMDRAFVERGHTVIPSCELDPVRRSMYESFVGGKHLFHDIKHVIPWARNRHFNVIIGGIPCQQFSTTRSQADRTKSTFQDLTPQVRKLLSVCTWDAFLFENVSGLSISPANYARMDAMNYADPPQSRPRVFTTSLTDIPPQTHPGTIDERLAYPAVAGCLYGSFRASVLQGWPDFHRMPFSSKELQKALANGVPRCLTDSWIPYLEKVVAFAQEHRRRIREKSRSVYCTSSI